MESKDTLTPAQFRAWVKNALRKQSYKWGPRNEALKNARVDRGLYGCNQCQKIIKRAEAKIDHIVPVVPIMGWDSWDNVISRLFCDVTGFQILCQNCHKYKTAHERLERQKWNKKGRSTGASRSGRRTKTDSKPSTRPQNNRKTSRPLNP